MTFSVVSEAVEIIKAISCSGEREKKEKQKLKTRKKKLGDNAVAGYPHDSRSEAFLFTFSTCETA